MHSLPVQKKITLPNAAAQTRFAAFARTSIWQACCLIVLSKAGWAFSGEDDIIVHGIAFRTVPMGESWIGAVDGDSEAESNEFPRYRFQSAHEFLLSKTEITVSQFEVFASSTGYVTQGETRHNTHTWRSDMALLSLDTPVRFVTWHDAKAYCTWLGEKAGVSCRLPSENEWEYACRAGQEDVYGIGAVTDLDDYAVLSLDTSSPSTPLPVLSRKPNHFGLHGMLGNVSEWCENEFVSYQDQRRGVNRMIRGGSYYKHRSLARCSSRIDAEAGLSFEYVGFRVVIEK